MPTIRAENSEYVEAESVADALVASGATGTPIFISGNVEGRKPLLDDWHPTGFVGFSLGKTIGKPYWVAGDHGDHVVMYITPVEVSNDVLHYGSVEPTSMTPVSPLVRSQIEQIVNGVSVKLQQRLSQFGNNGPGQDPVSTSTMTDVNNLVTWLCKQSSTVSATVANDGMLSIATVFPNDVRLYVEIERDGSVGAAVTRDRQYARDIPSKAVADLTSEVILAAVGSL